MTLAPGNPLGGSRVAFLASDHFAKDEESLLTA